MKNPIHGLLIAVILAGCNPVTLKYTLIYTDETPNEEFAKTLEKTLESDYNVDIMLKKAEHVQEVIDSLQAGYIDMGLVENFTQAGENIRTVVPVYPKALHLFYQAEVSPNSFQDLFYDRPAYIGPMGSSSYKFMNELFSFYNMDTTRLNITEDMAQADVLALFRIIMTKEELVPFRGYKLYSMDNPEQIEQGAEVEGIALQFPRVRPFIIPEKTYGELTSEPVVTISTDMMYVVREGLGSVAVADLIRSMFASREEFVHLHSSFYYGIIEDFDRSKLSYPLHNGARQYLNRDEPGFFERYAELAGVLFTISLAIGSGLISLSKWRKQRKKDEVDVFYGELIEIQAQIQSIRSVQQGRELIRQIREKQSKAFDMLIKEELEADDSFRIYMELSRETIDDIRYRLRLIRAHQARASSTQQ
jgi:TRAP-type uncharacterized transport system substrate-binding protein